MSNQVSFKALESQRFFQTLNPEIQKHVLDLLTSAVHASYNVRPGFAYPPDQNSMLIRTTIQALKDKLDLVASLSGFALTADDAKKIVAMARTLLQAQCNRQLRG